MTTDNEKLWNMRVTVMLVGVCALGTVPKSLKKYWKNRKSEVK